MAHTAATNFFIYVRSEQFTVRRPYCVPQFDDAISSSRHAIFAFIVTLLIGLLQIKYQGKDKSPFENQPVTMAAAITSLLIYCFSYYLMPRNSQHPFPSSSSSTSSSQAFNSLVRTTMVFSCPLTIAFFLSVLFPGSITRVLLLSLSIFFPLTQSFAPQMQAILNWVTKAAGDIMFKWFDQSQARRGPTSVQLPGIPQRTNINRAHLLPLYGGQVYGGQVG